MLSVKHLSKHYGGVHALEDVSFTLKPGEVMGLVGDNGAGKSTLLNLLAGNLTPTSGQIALGKTTFTTLTPQAARQHGIHVVYQDLALCDDLSAAENIFLGDEPSRYGVVDTTRMNREATDLLTQLGIKVDVTRPVRWLSGGQRQAVAFARALRAKPKLLLLDEPTAAMGVQQSRATLALIKGFKQRGTAIILISHNLADILKVSDTITVLRHGCTAATLKAKGTSTDKLTNLISEAKQ
ncbi:MAG: ATP-binding cassette domain-containing protein [Proteobacteria bacterium]|nr:ATP-binding cassette domain-containing protein [Pseudomonadota bacterium]